MSTMLVVGHPGDRRHRRWWCCVDDVGGGWSRGSLLLLSSLVVMARLFLQLVASIEGLGGESKILGNISSSTC